MGSSRTRAQTRVPCIGRRTPNHCATREAPGHLILIWTIQTHTYLRTFSMSSVWKYRQPVCLPPDSHMPYSSSQVFTYILLIWDSFPLLWHSLPLCLLYLLQNIYYYLRQIVYKSGHSNLYHPVCVSIFQWFLIYFSTKEGVYFSIPWIWARLIICFNQKNVTEVILWELQT